MLEWFSPFTWFTVSYYPKGPSDALSLKIPPLHGPYSVHKLYTSSDPKKLTSSKSHFQPPYMYLVGILSSRGSLRYIGFCGLTPWSKVTKVLLHPKSLISSQEVTLEVELVLLHPLFSININKLKTKINHFWGHNSPYIDNTYKPIYQNDPLDERIPTRYIYGG